MQSKQTKRERYEQLAAMPEGTQTDEERTERIQLFYELDPSRQYWNEGKPLEQQRTPQGIWGIDTSSYC